MPYHSENSGTPMPKPPANVAPTTRELSVRALTAARQPEVDVQDQPSTRTARKAAKTSIVQASVEQVNFAQLVGAKWTSIGTSVLFDCASASGCARTNIVTS